MNRECPSQTALDYEILDGVYYKLCKVRISFSLSSMYCSYLKYRFTIPTLTLIILFFLFFDPCFADKVIEVSSEGRTEQEAINKGVRKAVEQVLGLYVSSESSVMQGRLIYDKIRTSSAGYVKGYKVIQEIKDPFSGIFKIRLRVVVDDIKMEDVIKQFFSDKRFQKTFQDIEFNKRRVVVMYLPEKGSNIPYESRLVKTVIDLIEDRLVDMGFRVFLPPNAIANNPMEIARKSGSDAAVVVSLDYDKYPATDGYSMITSTLTLKAYDVSTGELFANVQEGGKAIFLDYYNIQDGIERVALKIAPKAVDRLVKKIVKRFSTVRENFVVLVLRHVNPELQEMVEEKVLIGSGWKYRIISQSQDEMRIEIFTDVDPTSVRWILNEQFKAKKIPLKPIEMQGSMIVFGSI